MKAVREGAALDMLTESSNHVVTNDGDGVTSNGCSEAFPAAAVQDTDMTTLGQDSSNGCSDTCKNGYCVACLSGRYPIVLDW